ncbi:MAG: tetratricopeptide repeat protein [Tannerella sp.]|jgi:tetratricopeptide (TPR) repeat protein|nr:tetratricopeptide repeat protein [Tannerella sp.]
MFKTKNQKFSLPIARISGKFCFIAVAICLFSATYATANGLRQTKAPDGKALTAEDQRKLDYFYYEGIKLKNLEKYDAAYEMFSHCLAIDSTSSAALFEMSSFYLQMNKPEQAASMLRRAVEYNPGNFAYKLALASLSLNIGMFGEAAETYEDLLKDNPDKVELNFYLSEALTQQGEVGKAIEALDRLENSIGMSEPLSIKKYQLYMSVKEEDRAFKELDKLAAKYPSDARYPILTGDLYLENNDTKHALEYYKKAHTIDPENPYYIVSMANYYEVTGNAEAAEQQIRSALVNERLDVETKVAILARYIQRLQQSRKDTEAANTLFDTLLNQHPEDINIKMIYGTLLMSQNKTDEARFQFQLATELDPSLEQAWQQLLAAAMQASDYERVVSICAKCRELFPDEPAYYLYEGVAYMQQKKYDEALTAYQSCIQNFPDASPQMLSDYYGQIGDVYFQMEKRDEAFAAYDKALEYNEQNIVVLNNYSYYLSLSKIELDKAERMSAKCIKAEPNNATYLDTYAWVFFVKGNYLLAKIYIEKAISQDREKSAELFDHYGDILFKAGDKEKAVEQWLKAKEAGKSTPTLERKIAEKTYFETPENEP